MMRLSSDMHSILLLLISMGIVSKARGEESLKERCKDQLTKCSLKNECFLYLKNEASDLIDRCPDVAIRQRKSLYKKESLAFAIHPSLVDEFPADRTHSVYLSDQYNGDNLELVQGCCHLRESHNCTMPAAITKNRRFFVIFPYKENHRSIYCWHRVPYSDSPFNECGDEKDVIDHCWKFEDGDFKIIHRFQPLSPSDALKLDRCYFRVSSGKLPINLEYNYNQIDKTYISVRSTGDDTVTVLIGNSTMHQCTVHHRVNANIDLEITKAMMDNSDDLICFGFKLPNTQSFQNIAFCKRIRLPTSKKLLEILAVIASAVVLLLLIATVKLCRIHKKNKILKGGLEVSTALKISKTELSPIVPVTELRANEGMLTEQRGPAVEVNE